MFKKYILIFFALITCTCINASESQCYGTTSKGSIKDAVQLPLKGNNFTSYSTLGHMLGRTYVHSKVSKIVLTAYQILEEKQPNTQFKYAETGFKEGGIFKPHKTHQNGLSVDFMVPVLNPKGKSVLLPTNLSNKYGYDIEFNDAGEFGTYTIDFDALAAHLLSLDQVAKQMGMSIKRVIFDPKLQPKLIQTQGGKYISENIPLSTKRVWVRHDEHYHVDFNLTCSDQ